MSRSPRHRHGPEDDDEINLTPMLDVVFIMLIFFIVTTSFVQEPGLDPQRPDAQTAAQRAGSNVLVAISGHGQVWMQKRPVSPTEVRALAGAVVAQAPGSRAIIIADERAPVGLILTVMDELRGAGIRDVSLGADPVD